MHYCVLKIVLGQITTWNANRRLLCICGNSQSLLRISFLVIVGSSSNQKINSSMPLNIPQYAQFFLIYHELFEGTQPVVVPSIFSYVREKMQ